MTRVLVVRLDGMGDVLLAGPAVRAVAADRDVSRITMLCGPAGAAAARMLPGVDEVLVWEAPWVLRDAPAATPAHLERLFGLLRPAAVDVALILTSFHQSPLPTALALRLVGVRFIAAISTDYGGSLLDVRLMPDADVAEDLPEPERALAVASAGGYELPEHDDGALAVTGLGEIAPPLGAASGYVVVHPGATAPARRWSPQRFAASVRALRAEGWDVVVTGSPGERALTAEVSGRGREALDLGGELTLPQLAAVLSRASVMVCGNTGPAHLAAAVGAPVVSLFSPVVPAIRWAPYRVRHILLGDQTARCRGTRAVACPIPGHPCLESVQPADVVAACAALTLDDPMEAAS